jgi:hypothetical protein
MTSQPDQQTAGRITLSSDLASVTSVHIQTPEGMDAEQSLDWARKLRDALSAEISAAPLCPYHSGASQDAKLVLIEACQEAAEQFDFYAVQHDAKGTPQSSAKADVNRRKAARMRSAIACATGDAANG